MLNNRLSFWILEAGIIMVAFLLISCVFESIQRFLDHNYVMHKIYNRELQDVVNSIDITDENKK